MNNSKEITQDKNTTGLSLLAKFSLSLYIISLCVPAILDAPGIVILFIGLIYSWFFPASWAYFANFAFFYILIRYKSRPLFSAIFLVLFTLLVPVATTISNWGWGAIFWVAANFILSADIFLQHKNLSRSNQKKIAIGILSVFLLPAIYFYTTQHALATDAEKAKYLKNGTAFTTGPITGIEEIPPPQNLGLKKGTVIEIIGEVDKTGAIFRDKNFAINLPSFFQQKNQFVRRFTPGYPKFYPIKLYSAAKPVDFYYGIKQRKDNENLADIFILDKHKKTIWNAPLALVKKKWRDNYKSIYPNTLPLGYWDKISDKMDNDDGVYSIKNKQLKAEETNERCLLEKQQPSTDKSSNKLKWDDKIIEFSDYYGEIKTKFCSENYVFFVFLHNKENKVSIVIFNRSNMYPLYYFYENKDNNNEIWENAKQSLLDDKTFSSIKSIAFTPYENSKEEAESLTIYTKSNGVMTFDNGDTFD